MSLNPRWQFYKISQWVEEQQTLKRLETIVANTLPDGEYIINQILKPNPIMEMFR